MQPTFTQLKQHSTTQTATSVPCYLVICVWRALADTVFAFACNFWLRMLAKGCLRTHEELCAPQSVHSDKPPRLLVLKLLVHWIHLGNLHTAWFPSPEVDVDSLGRYLAWEFISSHVVVKCSQSTVVIGSYSLAACSAATGDRGEGQRPRGQLCADL